MSIKWKLLLVVGVPISAILIIFIVGLSSFNIIHGDMNAMNGLHMDRATMIDADRDAYQAQVAILEAVEAKSAEELSKAKTDIEENAKQTWERILGPAEHFTPDMSNGLATFKTEYDKWKKGQEEILTLSAKTMEANLARDEAEKQALASFDSMREVINNLGELAGKKLKTANLDQAERRRLEEALDKILNGDRDAYQAYVAQILIVQTLDAERVAGLAESYEENLGQTRDRISAGADLIGWEGSEFKEEFMTQLAAWQSHSQKVVELSKGNIDDNIREIELIAQSGRSFSAMREAINQLGEKEVNRVEAALTALEEIISTTIWTYVLISILFTIAAVIVTLIFSTKVANVMRLTAQVAKSLSNGDFTVRLDVKRNDEIGQLADAINSMIERLRSIVFEVQSATGNVAASSEELAGASQALSQGATEQASAVEEVSASMEQMSSSISQNSESSGKTEGIARKTAKEGKQGGEAVRQTVEAMTQIAEKISIIEEIARQTNLLALNAAIEAARAGEQGKGFAVVAAEVRKLAERSGTAAAEIGELSASSVEVATRAGEMLKSIVPNIEETAGMIQEISAASNEQNVGASEISNALQQLDNVIQSNASSSEEIASTAEELSSQAAQLETTMGFFKLGAKSTGTPAPSNRTVVKKHPHMLTHTAQKTQGIDMELDDDMDDSFEKF
ncbi:MULTISPECIES: methyl-accepting chemotaxis protein [unclassified Pseudodesulfovibrio]|uniref:HAMP domain-containing methyl-accepting chemotaxis protein n=1 Tax=unclassified Pseudodesulfovibrio TaxID=2661612 RepID=UPI000FEBA0EC|nr:MULTISPECIES: methyl-accepting chemotaxis protein [unclassified Pseudodesulfovibrio]MCJ2164512.1 methyl-accepting chemotaxis protein [Pseudodesulfovibrio sp. S3-i]RWU04711.1 methyl-accepting chemotaxis protein [Pseudodesulfovibrio sp. S3]